MNASGRALAALLFAGVAGTAAAQAPRFRVERSLDAAPGWARLEVPDDVLDACRSGFPDLRILDASGREVPWAPEPRAAAPRRFGLTDVERVPERETTAIADRGPSPLPVASVTLEFPDAEFLKPVVLEASDDRASWREIARGSVFATRAVRATTLRFAPSTRRYLRIRLDDRNGDPVTPAALLAGAPSTAPVRTIRLEVATPAASDAGATRQVVTLSLPARNLELLSLSVGAADAAFSRRARVYERVLFRGEASRRLLGEATIGRAPGAADTLSVALGTASGRSLELEIERGDAPPLALTAVSVDVAPARLLFVAPGGPLRLAYGSRETAAPRYDLAAALQRGAPKAAATTLGAASAPREEASLLDAIVRGEPLDVGRWRIALGVTPPASGRVATLDVASSIAARPHELRLVDEANRPVPHLLESEIRRRRQSAAFRASRDGTRTLVEVGSSLDEALEGLVLDAKAPPFFARDVRVETPGPERGTWRVVATARWERRPGETPEPLVLGFGSASGPLRVTVENGENAPIEIASASVERTFRRLDFAFRPGEKLRLLADNGAAASPNYDIALLADLVFSAPADAAALEALPVATGPGARPSWLGGAVAVAGVLLVLALGRTLRRGS